jgi:diguanylate cyclase
MSTSLAHPNEADWKERYFRALFELDEKDRQAGERVAALTRPLSRLMVALEPSLPQHAPLITELKSALESATADGAVGSPALRLAEALEEAPAARSSPARPPGSLEAALLAALPVAQVELSSLLGQSPAADASPATALAWLEELLACLQRHLGPGTVARSPEPPHFEEEPLSRLLANLEGVSFLDEHVERLREALATDGDRVHLLREVDNLAVRLSSALSLAGEETSLDNQREMMLVAQNLEGLLNRIDFPGDLVPRVQSLRVLLGSTASHDELQTAVGQFGELVRTAMRLSRREIKEAERFLGEVLQRLENIQGHVTSERESQSLGHRHRSELESSVGSSVSRLQDHLEQEPSLAELKAVIAETLHGINCSVGHFLSVETERANAAEAKIEALQEHMEILEREADALRTSMRQEHQRATRDALTGVANRLAWEDRLHFEYDRWKRYGAPLALIVVDVDFFKSINDRFGHQTGDRVLRAVAAQVVRNVRETDFVARYGGEEFVVLLPGTSLEAAVLVADKLRQHVAGCRFQHRDDTVQVTVSCGVASFRAGDSTETVFQRADEALYRAKHAGRNAVLPEEGAPEAQG